ncbi:MAG: methylated-DNA--[protein]-cysteine S-methyltransferase [Byssovorax sp.]
MKARRAAEGYAIFATAIGPCGVAWSSRGLVSVQLPDVSEAATLARLQERIVLPDSGGSTSPPRAVKAAIERIILHLTGEDGGLDAVDLDLEGVPPFHRKVYEAARRITRGEIRRYGDLATEAGSPKGSRAVGQAMAKNPLPIVVPCHRVIAGSGKPGGFSAPGGLDTKARLLAIEGASLPGKK